MFEKNEQKPTNEKKPYRKPDLKYWGTLQEITSSGGKTSIHGDFGTVKGNKQTS